MIRFLTANIIQDLQKNFTDCIFAYEKATNNEISVIGSTCFSNYKSINYGSSFFDYGLAIKLNIFIEKNQVGEKNICITSPPTLWNESKFIPFAKKYGLSWLYETTKLSTDITTFYYPKFSILQLQTRIFEKAKIVENFFYKKGKRYFCIDTSRIYIKNNRIYYKKPEIRVIEKFV